MPNVSIKTMDEATSVPSPGAYSGTSDSLAYFDSPRDPLHLHLHDLSAGETLRIERSDIDRLAYVWQGKVEAGGIPLGTGSSLIVEHGQALEIRGADESSRLLTFSPADSGVQTREGGHIHLLPAERVPRCESRAGSKGGMHADSACPTCELWLHENHFPGRWQVSDEDAEKGIHAHTEDEIIFVTAGEMCFGNRSGGPGTAVAIAADTFYSFTAGPEGLSFINFRARKPEEIVFKNGGSMSETGYWRDLVARPEYLIPG